MQHILRIVGPYSAAFVQQHRLLPVQHSMRTHSVCSHNIALNSGVPQNMFYNIFKSKDTKNMGVDIHTYAQNLKMSTNINVCIFVFMYLCMCTSMHIFVKCTSRKLQNALWGGRLRMGRKVAPHFRTHTVRDKKSLCARVLFVQSYMIHPAVRVLFVIHCKGGILSFFLLQQTVVFTCTVLMFCCSFLAKFSRMLL